MAQYGVNCDARSQCQRVNFHQYDIIALELMANKIWNKPHTKFGENFYIAASGMWVTCNVCDFFICFFCLRSLTAA